MIFPFSRDLSFLANNLGFYVNLKQLCKKFLETLEDFDDSIIIVWRPTAKRYRFCRLLLRRERERKKERKQHKTTTTFEKTFYSTTNV